ncbi:aspartyl-phosphate phosphatase Spo0E family protein [Neobacillus cucumis]|uniref:aspartyl-phosphate phosphatase Spo0E family protein n=1 Tax=Neobacillus cucumis TaxID=1740721 RepID=UPI0018E0065A|nr:aspartyl-phosphate phosphatase Spo0E family protein [Neobacillus cucumis]MBI0580125.1 aspartyl-phosphate phosphatase Spo0E family protein [Neobacillus cucumis]
MNKEWCESLLLNQIDLLKKKMIDLAKGTGINSYETLRCSQELDTVLNLHMKHFSHKNELNTAS